MTISALPSPPQSSDPANFSARADAFLAALPEFVAQLNALPAELVEKLADVLNAYAAATLTLTNKTLTDPVINAINGTSIGAINPSTGAFTEIKVNGRALSLASNIAFTGLTANFAVPLAATYTLPNLATCTLATLSTLTQTFSGVTTFSAATLTLGSSTAASTYSLGSGATLTATTKTINIGTAGVSGSITNVNIGSAVAGAGGTTTINTPVLKLVGAATASAPTYVKGGIYFDTTLNKLRIGGATAWETVTSA